MTLPLHPLFPGLLLALLALARPWLDASMTLHMVLELPLLAALGALAARTAVAGRRAAITRPYAAVMLLAALLLISIWMLPLALDLAVVSAWISVAKALAMLLAGALLWLAWRSAGLVLQAFLMLSWGWMNITAGILYQEAPAQLCSVYLSEQQWTAGTGLIALSGCALTLWLLDAMILPALREARQ